MYLVVDIGSNTIRVVIFRVEDNQMNAVLNKKYPAGLANYINKKNVMTDEGIESLVEIMQEVKSLTNTIKFKEVYAFATASLRNIDNTQEVIKKVKKQADVDIKVLSGQEEALYDYYGAIKQSQVTDGLLIDIGGGSTELVLFNSNEVVIADSIPVGSLNMYNKYSDDIIISTEATADIENEVYKKLDKLPVKDLKTIDTIYGVGGTARAVLKIYKKLKKCSVECDRYGRTFIDELLELNRNDKMNFTELVLKNAPERIHTLVPGMAILNAIAKKYKCETIVTSSHGVREGYLYYKLEKAGEITNE